MLSNETIKILQKDSAFAEFRDFVFSKIKEIDSTDGLERLSNAQAGEEAKIRAKTATKLMSILNPILNFKEREEPGIDKVIEAKKRSGL
jgi:hypothetical protein